MFTLNPRDSKPIYTQIKEQFIRFILTGVLCADEKLPSVRELARQLSINPNTIQRAYAELEAEGYCYSRAGKGSFVADSASWDSTHRKEVQTRFLSAAAEMRALGFTTERLQKLLEENF